MLINYESSKIESFNNELTFMATREFNSKLVTCIGENIIGTTTLNKTLDIICKLI